MRAWVPQPGQRSPIEEPLRRIAKTAGHESSVVVNKVKEGTGAFGFKAASVASLLLTTEAMIAEQPKSEKAAAPTGDYGSEMDY